MVSNRADEHAEGDHVGAVGCTRGFEGVARRLMLQVRRGAAGAGAEGGAGAWNSAACGLKMAFPLPLSLAASGAGACEGQVSSGDPERERVTYHESSNSSSPKYALGFLRLWSVGVLTVVVDPLDGARELRIEPLLPPLGLELLCELSGQVAIRRGSPLGLRILLLNRERRCGIQGKSKSFSPLVRLGGERQRLLVPRASRSTIDERERNSQFLSGVAVGCSVEVLLEQVRDQASRGGVGILLESCVGVPKVLLLWLSEHPAVASARVGRGKRYGGGEASKGAPSSKRCARPTSNLFADGWE